MPYIIYIYFCLLPNIRMQKWWKCLHEACFNTIWQKFQFILIKYSFSKKRFYIKIVFLIYKNHFVSFAKKVFIKMIRIFSIQYKSLVAIGWAGILFLHLLQVYKKALEIASSERLNLWQKVKFSAKNEIGMENWNFRQKWNFIENWNFWQKINDLWQIEIGKNEILSKIEIVGRK